MRKLIAGIVITGALIAGSIGFAADGDKAPTTNLQDEDLAQLTIDDMVDRASTCVRRMENQLSKSFKMLEESIADGDVAATTARNEAITAMKGLVKLSEQNLLTLQQKAAERDRKRVEHEYVKITIACRKVGEFYAQVRSATGIPIDLELTDVERRLVFEGRLPVVESLTTLYAEPANLPAPPVHASPYF